MCKGLAALPHTCLERAKEIKTKLGTLLQKPDSAIDLIIPYPEKPEKPAKAQKTSPDEALQWRESLEKLLQNAYGLASFRSFLRSEFSEENIEFWIACEEYKKIKSPTKMAEKAKKIYEEFIQTEAPKEISPDAACAQDFNQFINMESLTCLYYSIINNILDKEKTNKTVNIDHCTKAVTMKNLVEPSVSSFTEAQKRIFALMEKDSLPRFVRSEFYQELIK
ncbi:regulator of G-protein signaling 5 isoform X1 [Chrysemys picta bellii]|uniref:regulator of G-protein signaling 5 isoform X1 n=1 Tax=Chrysemys picta bellii TaxID=8478 RepID=UPI0032B305BF